MLFPIQSRYKFTTSCELMEGVEVITVTLTRNRKLYSEAKKPYSCSPEVQEKYQGLIYF